jgi:L-fuconolactonase
VLDHLGKPPIAGGDLEAWAEAVAPLSELPNVSCKVSGLATEAGTTDGLAPFVRRALAWFGPERCLWGSDWPVCTLVASYGEALALVADALEPAERDAVLGGAAVRVYALSC